MWASLQSCEDIEPSVPGLQVPPQPSAQVLLVTRQPTLVSDVCHLSQRGIVCSGVGGTLSQRQAAWGGGRLHTRCLLVVPALGQTDRQTDSTLPPLLDPVAVPIRQAAAQSQRNWGRGSRWPQLPPGSLCSFPLNRMGSRMFGGGGPAASSWGSPSPSVRLLCQPASPRSPGGPSRPTPSFPQVSVTSGVPPPRTPQQKALGTVCLHSPYHTGPLELVTGEPRDASPPLHFHDHHPPQTTMNPSPDLNRPFSDLRVDKVGSTFPWITGLPLSSCVALDRIPVFSPASQQ